MIQNDKIQTHQSRTSSNPIRVNTKHLYDICRMLDQRGRRWADVGQMLYKCFGFVGMHLIGVDYDIDQ